MVNRKVAWPYEHILGGLNHQRFLYNQVSLTQFVQRFVKNIIDEQDRECKDWMLHYLGDLMEDATDFTWSSTKSAYAVLLREMEPGLVDWYDTARKDRIRHSNAQYYNPPPRQNWYKIGTKLVWIGKKKHSNDKLIYQRFDWNITEFNMLGLKFSVNLQKCQKSTFFESCWRLKTVSITGVRENLVPWAKLL